MKKSKQAEARHLPLKDALLVLGISLLLVITVGGTVQIFSLLPGVYVTEWLLILLPPLVFLKVNNKDMKSILKLKNFTGKNLTLGILGGFGIFVLSALSGLLAQEILGPYPITPIAENIPSSWFGFIPWVFGLGVSAGICEEVLFRGFIQEGLSNRWSELKVVVIAAAIFSVFHLDPWRLLSTFIMGLTAGYLLIETDSLLTPITLHVTSNTIALSIAFAL